MRYVFLRAWKSANIGNQQEPKICKHKKPEICRLGYP